jgi:hypothetical protein
VTAAEDAGDEAAVADTTNANASGHERAKLADYLSKRGELYEGRREFSEKEANGLFHSDDEGAEDDAHLSDQEGYNKFSNVDSPQAPRGNSSKFVLLLVFHCIAHFNHWNIALTLTFIPKWRRCREDLEYSEGEETEEDDNADVDEASTVEGNIVGAEDPRDVGVVEQTAVEEMEEDDNADVVEPSVEVNIFGAEDPMNFGVAEPMAVALPPKQK